MTTLEQLPAQVADLTSQIVQLRDEMRVESSAVRTEIRDVDHLLRDSVDDLRRHMLVLHEEVIGRLALIQEAGTAAPPRPRRRPKR